VSLYLKEDEEVFVFLHQKFDFFFYNISIKRPIKKIGNKKITDGFYDLETAYGYGGFYVNTSNKDFIQEAMLAYVNRCKDENIIAEFVRFHPFNSFPIAQKDLLDFVFYDRDVVIVDLSLSRDARWSQYSSTTRNILRKSSLGLMLSQSDKLKDFIDLYNDTMLKNNANDFYFFDEKYFSMLKESKNVILFDVCDGSGLTLSSSFFMFGQDLAHYHLSANNYSVSHSGNYFMLEQLFEIAIRQGKKYFLLGGGSTNRVDDSLFKFKSKFSKLTRPFYIGGKVYNKAIYDKYCNMWLEDSSKDIKYFLKYRLETE
jgi:hypothetical protein